MTITKTDHKIIPKYKIPGNYESTLPFIRSIKLPFLVTKFYFYFLFRLTGDLALVELNDDVTYSDHVQPACLPQPPESDGIPLTDKYTNCYIVGWGKTFETGKCFFFIHF